MSDDFAVDVVARKALEFFGLTGATLTPLSLVNNAVYRIDETLYTLRLHRPGGRQRAWIESELAWLKTLGERLCVPQPAAPLFTTVLNGEPVYAVLFRWLEGNPVTPSACTVDHARLLGTFTAEMHRVPTPPLELPRLDWAGMFGAQSPYHAGEGEALFSDDDRAVMNAVAARVAEVMKALDQKEFGVIHADLIWKNILFNEGQVCAIDFDNCAYGYYLYDLAPPLIGWYDEPHYPELQAALWEGYTRVRPLPEDYLAHLDTLVAGRYVLSCRWVAGNLSLRERAQAIIAYRINELRQYLKTGVFRRGMQF